LSCEEIVPSKRKRKGRECKKALNCPPPGWEQEGGTPGIEKVPTNAQSVSMEGSKEWGKSVPIAF